MVEVSIQTRFHHDKVKHETLRVLIMLFLIEPGDLVFTKFNLGLKIVKIHILTIED